MTGRGLWAKAEAQEGRNRRQSQPWKSRLLTINGCAESMKRRDRDVTPSGYPVALFANPECADATPGSETKPFGVDNDLAP